MEIDEWVSRHHMHTSPRKKFHLVQKTRNLINK